MGAGVLVGSPIRYADFSGGLNLRDSSDQLAPNESPDMMNVILDQRGGLEKRLGYTKDGGMSAFAANCVNSFYSWVLGQIVVQEGVNVRKRTAAGTFSSVKAFSTAARVTFCDFHGKMLMLHPVDGLFSYDGTTVSARLGTHVGVDIAAFQNKVWTATGTALAAERTRVNFCAAGDETTWAGGTAGSVDIREIDDAPLTCLIGDSGQDVAGRGGLLVFKEKSAYRIHSSVTGDFVTIDPANGASGALAACGIPAAPGEATAVVNKTGIYITTGRGKLEKASGRIDPLFTPTFLEYEDVDAFCSVAQPDGHLLFSVRKLGSSENDLTIEYDPSVGWMVPHSFSASSFAAHGATGQVYHTDPGSGRFLYETFSGGSDNGTDITARSQTRWEHLIPGQKMRLQRVSLYGRGIFSFGLVLDHATGVGFQQDFVGVDDDLFTWGTSVWGGTDVWGPSHGQFHQTFWPRKAGGAMSFRVDETSSLTSFGDEVLGESPTAHGAFSLFEIRRRIRPGRTSLKEPL